MAPMLDAPLAAADAQFAAENEEEMDMTRMDTKNARTPKSIGGGMQMPSQSALGTSSFVLELRGACAKEVPAQQRQISVPVGCGGRLVVGKAAQADLHKQCIVKDCLPFINGEHFELWHDGQAFRVRSLTGRPLWIDQQGDGGAGGDLVELGTDEFAALPVGGHVVLSTGASNLDPKDTFHRLRWCLLDASASAANPAAPAAAVRASPPQGAARGAAADALGQAAFQQRPGAVPPRAIEATTTTAGVSGGELVYNPFAKELTRAGEETQDMWFGSKAAVEALISSKAGLLFGALPARRAWSGAVLRGRAAALLKVPSHELTLQLLDGDSRIDVKDDVLLGDMLGAASTATFEASWAHPLRRAATDRLAQVHRAYRCPETQHVLQRDETVYIVKQTDGGWAFGYRVGSDEIGFYFPTDAVRLLPSSEVNLRITDFTGRHWSVAAPRWWRIAYLKARIQKETGISASDQKLLANGVHFEGTEFFGDHFFPESSFDLRVAHAHAEADVPQVGVEDEAPEQIAKPYKVVRENIPNSDMELHLVVGAIVMVVEQEDSGWWGGYYQHDGSECAKWFPGVCVQPVEP